MRSPSSINEIETDDANNDFDDYVDTPKKKPWLRPRLILVSTTFFLYMFGFTFLSPLQPLILLRLCNNDYSKASNLGGWLGACNAGALFFTSALLGSLSDRVGRKPMFLICQIGPIIDILGYLLATDVWMLFITRSVAGLLSGYISLTGAYVADITTTEKRAHGFGMVAASVGIALVFAPLLSGIIAQKFSINASIYTTLGVQLTNLLFIVFLVPESLKEKKQTSLKLNPFHSFHLLFQHNIVIYMSGVFILLNLALEGVFDVSVMYVKYVFKWDTFKLGLLISVLGISLVFQAPVLKVIIPRMGERKYLLLGTFVGGVSACLYAIAPYGWMLFPIYLIRALAVATLPATQSLVSRHYGADLQGELLGVMGSLRTLSSCIGPVLFSHLFSYFISDKAPVKIPGITFFVSGGISAICLLLEIVAFAWVPEVPHKSSKKEEEEGLLVEIEDNDFDDELDLRL